MGETRPSNWQYCQLHVLKSSNRQFTLESSSKPSPPSAACDENGLFACAGCSRSFRSRAGLATHRRYCSSSSTDSLPSTSGRGLEPLVKQQNLNAKESKVFKRKIAHWLLIRKNRELRNGTRCFRDWKCNLGTDDINLKTRLKKAALTIVPCLQNDHSLCTQSSFVCKGGADPYLYMLPHGRPITSMPPSVRDFVANSVNDIFFTSKLDRLLFRGRLQTTSQVESVHRTIRLAAPKVVKIAT